MVVWCYAQCYDFCHSHGIVIPSVMCLVTVVKSVTYIGTSLFVSTRHWLVVYLILE